MTVIENDPDVANAINHLSDICDERDLANFEMIEMFHTGEHMDYNEEDDYPWEAIRMFTRYNADKYIYHIDMGFAHALLAYPTKEAMIEDIKQIEAKAIALPED